MELLFEPEASENKLAKNSRSKKEIYRNFNVIGKLLEARHKNKRETLYDLF